MASAKRTANLPTLFVRNKSPRVSNRVEMSIVPWWYARLFAILYADPETWIYARGNEKTDKHKLDARAAGHIGFTHLFPCDANIVSFVCVRVYAERA